jgi:SAM-dependent methyltransferase
MESHEKDLRSAVESDEQRQAIQNDYRAAGLTPSEVVLLDYAVKLTKDPRAVGRGDLDALRRAGYSDEQLVDAVHCIGYFNFINRVLDGLGVDPEPGMRYAPPAIDIDALKSRLKATWMAGDFGLIARSYEAGAAEFVRRLAFIPGMRVLDVACGTGNLALPAARAGAVVTGADIATNLLEQARSRAAAESLSVRFDEGDAEKLPYPDASFDAVISMFGVMFAPRPELAAAELLRVCRPGGTIALANWTPGSFVGQMFKTIAGHVPPPAGVPSPLQWGDESKIRERLGGGVRDLKLTSRVIAFEFPFAPAEVVEFWRMYYGPTNRAFEALAAEPHRQAALRADLERLWASHNWAEDGSTRVEPEYQEVIATKN